MAVQGIGIPMGIIQLQGGLILIGWDGLCRQGGRLDAILRLNMEETTEGIEGHAGGIGLAVGGIARDVRRAYKYLI
jgi:hypothetical protein